MIVVLAIFSEPLVRLVFERGAFTPETTAAVSEVQRWLLPQIPFYVLVMVGYRLLSALDGNALVLRIGALNLLMNVGGNLVFMHWFGVKGIAMSTSLDVRRGDAGHVCRDPRQIAPGARQRSRRQKRHDVPRSSGTAPQGGRRGSSRPGAKMLGQTFFHSWQAVIQLRAQLSGRRSVADIRQKSHQFVVRLGRAVQHEMNPGPGIAIVVGGHLR